MPRCKAYSCDVSLPNGCKMQVFQRAKDSAWWVQACTLTTPYIPILKHVSDFEMADWVAPIIATLTDQKRSDVLPEELLERLTRAQQNRANSELHAERDRWLECAREIRFTADSIFAPEINGTTVTLADVLFVSFAANNESLIFSTPLSHTASDVSRQTQVEIREVRRQSKEVALALHWEIEERSYRPSGNLTITNAHVFRILWRDRLLALVSEEGV